MNQNAPNAPLSDAELDAEYQTILNQLTPIQYRFIVARLECKSDAEAARMLGLDEKTPTRWDEKKLINRAIELATRDGVVLALTMRRRSLPRAMAVKISGLESDNEKIRQDASTEIIEGELGKATQKSETSVKGSINLIWDLPKPKI
jgi:hypothetical protein